MTRTSFKYADFAQSLLRSMLVDRLKPGDRLPTEEEMVRVHGLSRITVRRALLMLERDGFVSRKRRLGTFVARTPKSAAELQMVRGIVVLVIPALTGHQSSDDHALASTVRGAEDELAKVGFAVHILSIGRDDEQDRVRVARLLENSRIEGICVIGSCFDGFAESVTVPLVNSCTFYPTRLPWVGINMEDVSYTCVAHLLDRGHRQIVTLVGPWVEARAVALMSRGHQRAFEERAASFRRTMIVQAYDEASIREVAMEVFLAGTRPTAIFAEDWRVSREVLRAANQLGLQIPNDISVVGCGQNNLYISSPSSISAYVPANEQVGREVARVLVQVIYGGTAPAAPTYVPGEFADRGSVVKLG